MADKDTFIVQVTVDFNPSDRKSSGEYIQAMPSHQRYESCVLQSDGKCHRSSHDHSGDF